MDKISVVVPTIQKNLKVLNKQLSSFIRDEAVSEIIIINNAKTPFIPSAEIKGSNKLKIFNQKENLYVNPSWNLGVSLCSNNKFFVTNDDILYVENFCTKVLETGILDGEDTGLIGLGICYMKYFEKDVDDIDIPVSTGEIYMVEMKRYLYTGDWGSGYFGTKENYYNIPDELKVIYGDNYLLYKNMQNDKINYEIMGLNFNHIHSLSSSCPEIESVVVNDCMNYKQYIEETEL